MLSPGGRHTCAIKSGVGWTDGVDYKDRLFCFGRNLEGQLDPPSGMSAAAWEMVYVSFGHQNIVPILLDNVWADTRDGRQLVDAQSKTHKFSFAGVIRAAQSCQAASQKALSERALFGALFL